MFLNFLESIIAVSKTSRILIDSAKLYLRKVVGTEAHFPHFSHFLTNRKQHYIVMFICMIPITEEIEYTWDLWEHLQCTSFILCSFFFSIKDFYLILFFIISVRPDLKSLSNKSNNGLLEGQFLFLFFL